VELVCIEGGPICQIEEQIMHSLREHIVQDVHASLSMDVSGLLNERILSYDHFVAEFGKNTEDLKEDNAWANWHDLCLYYIVAMLCGLLFAGGYVALATMHDLEYRHDINGSNMPYEDRPRSDCELVRERCKLQEESFLIAGILYALVLCSAGMHCFRLRYKHCVRLMLITCTFSLVYIVVTFKYANWGPVFRAYIAMVICFCFQLVGSYFNEKNTLASFLRTRNLNMKELPIECSSVFALLCGIDLSKYSGMCAFSRNSKGAIGVRKDSGTPAFMHQASRRDSRELHSIDEYKQAKLFRRMRDANGLVIGLPPKNGSGKEPANHFLVQKFHICFILNFCDAVDDTSSHSISIAKKMKRRLVTLVDNISIHLVTKLQPDLETVLLNSDTIVVLFADQGGGQVRISQSMRDTLDFIFTHRLHLISIVENRVSANPSIKALLQSREEEQQVMQQSFYTRRLSGIGSQRRRGSNGKRRVSADTLGAAYIGDRRMSLVKDTCTGSTDASNNIIWHTGQRDLEDIATKRVVREVLFSSQEAKQRVAKYAGDMIPLHIPDDAEHRLVKLVACVMEEARKSQAEKAQRIAQAAPLTVGDTLGLSKPRSPKNLLLPLSGPSSLSSSPPLDRDTPSPGPKEKPKYTLFISSSCFIPQRSGDGAMGGGGKSATKKRMIDPNELVELMEGHLSWVGAADSESGGDPDADLPQSATASMSKSGSTWFESFRSKDASKKGPTKDIAGSSGRNFVGGVLQHDPSTMSRPSHSIVTPGDKVLVTKKGSQTGKYATIVDGNWGGRVKVLMDGNSSTKSYFPSELKLEKPASRTGLFRDTNVLYYNEDEETVASCTQLPARRMSMPLQLAPLSSPEEKSSPAPAATPAATPVAAPTATPTESSVPTPAAVVQKRQKRRRSLVPIKADGSTVRCIVYSA
jgi:hypothetical protein